MPVGACLGIYKKPVQETKSQGKFMCIRRNILRRSIWRFSGIAGAKNGDRGGPVRFSTATACGQIAENLIVSPIFADNVNDVFERRSPAREKISLFASEQTIVSHRGLRVGI